MAQEWNYSSLRVPVPVLTLRRQARTIWSPWSHLWRWFSWWGCVRGRWLVHRLTHSSSPLFREHVRLTVKRHAAGRAVAALSTLGYFLRCWYPQKQESIHGTLPACGTVIRLRTTAFKQHSSQPCQNCLHCFCSWFAVWMKEIPSGG